MHSFNNQAGIGSNQQCLFGDAMIKLFTSSIMGLIPVRWQADEEQMLGGETLEVNLRISLISMDNHEYHLKNLKKGNFKMSGRKIRVEFISRVMVHLLD